MSRAFNGGSETYQMDVPERDGEVLAIVERFIRDNFKSGDEVASEIIREADKYLIFFADDDEETSPATLGQRDDELVAYGTFSYRAEEHSVQTIWENQFEIRAADDGVYIRVSDWYGTTVESWQKKIEREEMYV